MAEPMEVQMARLQEQLKTVFNLLTEEKETRREADKQLASIATTMTSLDKRLEVVEKQLAQNAPTIEEFTTIKYKVQGAGLAGKWAWAIGGVILTALYTGREAIRDWFLR